MKRAMLPLLLAAVLLSGCTATPVKPIGTGQGMRIRVAVVTGAVVVNL